MYEKSDDYFFKVSLSRCGQSVDKTMNDLEKRMLALDIKVGYRDFPEKL